STWKEGFDSPTGCHFYHPKGFYVFEHGADSAPDTYGIYRRVRKSCFPSWMNSLKNRRKPPGNISKIRPL
ncbi:MAG: hypothetical protein ACPHFU_09200, partial [Paracoccaceae bacterium]